MEISSGIGGLAYSWVLGRRREKELINFRPHNVSGDFLAFRVIAIDLNFRYPWSDWVLLYCG